jgi:hypothetical protein
MIKKKFGAGTAISGIPVFFLSFNSVNGANLLML